MRHSRVKVPEIKSIVIAAAAQAQAPAPAQQNAAQPPTPRLASKREAGPERLLAGSRWRSARFRRQYGGGYAEYCVTPEAQALPVPKGLSLVEAASLPETFFTVWSNVYDRAGLKPGESLLVQGGSSGIGVTAIQMAAATGNRVFATAGSDDKVAACVRLGAEKAFNYKTGDWSAELKAATAGKGVNVILDMVGGDYFPKELKALADDGRLVFIAFLRGAKTELDINELMRRRLTVSGSTLRPRTVEFKGYVATNLREKIWPLIDAGRIKPEIYKTFSLEDASEAHRLMESSQHIGKLVLTV